MVSNSSNPPGAFYLDPTGKSLPGPGQFSAGAGGAGRVAGSAASSGMEDLDKKVRKPYTSSKSRQSWTDPEHDKFLEALQFLSIGFKALLDSCIIEEPMWFGKGFDRDWKKIEAFIGSKTVIQIRSHAQKYFLKVQKSGGNERLPPPRPKRKAAHPYPHKALKSGSPLSQMKEPVLSSVSLIKPEYVIKHDIPSIPGDLTHNAAVASSWTDNSAQIPNASRGDIKSTAEAIAINSSSSAESTPRMQSLCRMAGQATQSQSVRVLPDFAQVYGFIGSVFDPNVTGHLQNLKQMDPIDVETVLLLMRNLSINLASPDFEDHRNLLSTYELDPEESSYDVVGI